MNNQRNFVIFDTIELPLIDFTQVKETSADTVRKSVDGTRTFVKWDGDIPSSVENLTTKSESLTCDEIIEILSTSEWTQSLKV